MPTRGDHRSYVHAPLHHVHARPLVATPARARRVRAPRARSRTQDWPGPPSRGARPLANPRSSRTPDRWRTSDSICAPLARLPREGPRGDPRCQSTAQRPRAPPGTARPPQPPYGDAKAQTRSRLRTRKRNRSSPPRASGAGRARPIQPPHRRRQQQSGPSRRHPASGPRQSGGRQWRRPRRQKMEYRTTLARLRPSVAPGRAAQSCPQAAMEVPSILVDELSFEHLDDEDRWLLRATLIEPRIEPERELGLLSADIGDDLSCLGNPTQRGAHRQEGDGHRGQREARPEQHSGSAVTFRA